MNYDKSSLNVAVIVLSQTRVMMHTPWESVSCNYGSKYKTTKVKDYMDLKSIVSKTRIINLKIRRHAIAKQYEINYGTDLTFNVFSKC